MTMLMTLTMASVRASMALTMGLVFSPPMMMAMEKMMVKTIRAIRLDLENSEGKSLTVNMPRMFMELDRSSTSWVRSSWTPAAVSMNRQGTTMKRQEMMPVTKVPIRKYIRIFRSLERSVILAMAAVSEQNISGTTQQYSRLRKISARGCSTEAPSPQKKPTTPPSTMAPSRIIEDL